MKRTFKTAFLAALVALGTVVAEQSAQAQFGNYTVLANSGNLTTNVMHTTTGGITNKYATRGEYLALQLDFACIAAGTSNTIVQIDKSVDGQTWSLIQSNNIAATGTTPVNWVTNITVGAVPQIRTRVTTQAIEAGAVTNLVLKATSR